MKEYYNNLYLINDILKERRFTVELTKVSLKYLLETLEIEKAEEFADVILYLLNKPDEELIEIWEKYKKECGENVQFSENNE